MVKEDIVNALIKVLHDVGEYEAVRIAAADGLGYSGFSVSARTALLRTAEDKGESQQIRASAIRALGHTVHTTKP
ncbi:hypothetical protein [Pseudomonas sp. COR18]|uniref:hypothetical protein n=1 Tax=Pseudomonas sp. COR18 TaxID=3399680 RepID=UPI003B00BCD8